MTQTTKEILQNLEKESVSNDFIASAARDWGEEGVIYLSGPIRLENDNGSVWREEIVDDYGDEFTFNNPLDRFSPSEVEIINNPDNFDASSEKKQILPSDYVASDKIDICASEFVFVGLPDAIARGTLMECMFAYFINKPFFVWLQDGQEDSGWVYRHAEFVSDDRNEVMEAIRNYE